MSKKHILVAIVIMSLSVFVGGCNMDTSSSNSESVVLGTLSHGASDVDHIKYKEDGYRVYYSGSQVDINYRIAVTGDVNNVGFLLFVDGIAQPYKTNITPSYEYMHEFNFNSGNDELFFTFSFVPVTGTVDKESTITVLSINSPNLYTVNENFQFVGLHHAVSVVNLPLYLNEQLTNEPFDFGVNILSKLKGIEITQGEIELDALSRIDEKGVTAQLLYDGSTTSEIQIDEDNLKMSFEIYDLDETRYYTTIFLNHEPIIYDGFHTFETKTINERKDILFLDFDVSKLSEKNVLYAISIPIDNNPGDEYVKPVIKSDTVLIRKCR